MLQSDGLKTLVLFFHIRLIDFILNYSWVFYIFLYRITNFFIPLKFIIGYFIFSRQIDMPSANNNYDLLSSAALTKTP